MHDGQDLKHPLMAILCRKSMLQDSFILHCNEAALPIYQLFSIAAQCNALHLNFTSLHCCNTVVSAKTEIMITAGQCNAGTVGV